MGDRRERVDADQEAMYGYPGEPPTTGEWHIEVERDGDEIIGPVRLFTAPGESWEIQGVEDAHDDEVWAQLLCDKHNAALRAAQLSPGEPTEEMVEAVYRKLGGLWTDEAMASPVCTKYHIKQALAVAQPDRHYTVECHHSSSDDDNLPGRVVAQPDPEKNDPQPQEDQCL